MLQISGAHGREISFIYTYIVGATVIVIKRKEGKEARRSNMKKYPKLPFLDMY